MYSIGKFQPTAVAPRATVARASAMAIVCAATLACRSEPEHDPKRFIPPAQTARAALSTALASWKAGRPAGQIAGQPAVIQYVDSVRKPSQCLTGFEILGEVPNDHYRCFKVRLNFDHPEEQSLARYLVFGMDPLWVYRAEELEMITHWEHHETPADETAGAPADAKHAPHHQDEMKKPRAVDEKPSSDAQRSTNPPPDAAN